MRTFLILLSLLTMSQLTGQEGNSSSNLKSVNWQKLELEKQLRSRLNRVLTTVLSEKEFVLDIDIDAQAPSKADFKAITSDFSDEKKETENSKSKVTISDVSPENLPQDYILFSKLGLEAPLIDDFQNFVEGEKSNSKTEDELQKSRNKDYFERLFRFNQLFDLFENLKSVNITISISDTINAEARIKVENLVKSLSLKIGKIRPNVNFSYISFDKGEIPKINEENLSNKDIWELASKFSTAIGLILTTLLLGFIAFMLFKKYEQLKHQELGLGNGQGEPGGAEESDEEEHSQVTMDNEAEKYLGYDRMKKLIEFNQGEAVLLVSQWLQTDDPESVNALRGIVQQLENEMIIRLLSKLSEAEKEMWKSKLDKGLSVIELKKTSKFIASQVVRKIMTSAIISDLDLQEMIIKLSPEKAAQFVQENLEYAPFLINNLSNTMVDRILSFLPSTIIAEVINHSFAGTDISFSSLKASLRNYVDDDVKIRTLDKIVQHIPKLVEEKELEAYSSLIQNDAWEYVEIAAEKELPSFLIFKLPDNVFAEILKSYAFEDRLKIVLCLHGADRNKVIDLSAPVGTKARDVLDMEMDEARSDIMFQKDLKENKNKILQKFIHHVRSEIKKNKEFKLQAKSLVYDWVENAKNTNDLISSISSLAS